MASSEFDFPTDKSHPLDLFPEHQFILSERGIRVMAAPGQKYISCRSGAKLLRPGSISREGFGVIRLYLEKKPTNRHSYCFVGTKEFWIFQVFSRAALKVISNHVRDNFNRSFIVISSITSTLCFAKCVSLSNFLHDVIAFLTLILR